MIGPVLRGAAIATAAFAAGAVNAAAGGGSLLTFPTLLALGYPAVAANVTNTVGLCSGYLGGSVAYRRELQSQRARVGRLLAPTVAGALVGAAALELGPAHLFATLAPWLILGASVLLGAQGLIRRVLGRHAQPGPDGQTGPALPAGEQTGPVRPADGRDGAGAALVVFAGSVYGAYFGGALGILLLALLGLTVSAGLQELNALKGVISLITNVVAALVFAVTGSVMWPVAALMAATSWLGGHLGVTLARRLPAPLLRGVVVAFGCLYALHALL